MSPQRSLIAMRVGRLRNHLLNLKKDSAAKTFVVLFGLINVVAIGLWVSYMSFDFIEGFIFGKELVAKLIALLFFALFILVTLSTIIISYTTLFIAKETEFFFQHPVPPRTILFTKTAEAISFSAWASLFLCFPVLISFGVIRGAPAAYYLEAAVVLITFLLFAGLIGTAIALLLTPVLNHLGRRKLLVFGCLALACVTWMFLRSFQFWDLDDGNNLLVLDRFMSGIRTMHSPYSPSRWASAAILASSVGNHGEVRFYWALLTANTAIFGPLLYIYGDRWFGREWISRRSVHRREANRPRRINSVQRSLCGNPISTLFVKDVLIFVRSPAQVSQSFLFLLLMIIYSLSLLRVPDYIYDDEIKLFVHFANRAAVCMILSSFTSRFLFPLLSLEGKAFWILGLAPMPRNRLLQQKVLFGVTISLTLGLLTITTSNIALGSPAQLFFGAVYTTCLASFCLTCMATGLGAAYPNFDEDNPARIAAGIGGTLNFFASALAVAVIVALGGFPYLVFGGSPPHWAVAAAHVFTLVVTLTICAFVLRLGGRALARSEF